MKDNIILSVPKGTQIRKSDGSFITLNDVPENALELIEAGATYLMFKKDAKEPLKKLSKERLIKILEIRKSQGLQHDVSVLELALAEKEASKNKPADQVPPEKSAKS
ncbi:hypothetical protein CMU51_00145 [Elizabethkingia anophelis]|uniref:Uncharacterized protein n=1 Tax=Elizabethkingia anophelis TaxID=1117645 RepID=A0AAE4T4G9_9FLAO|nr:hypothetical protein [Elizabethkingia anophelis]